MFLLVVIPLLVRARGGCGRGVIGILANVNVVAIVLGIELGKLRLGLAAVVLGIVRSVALDAVSVGADAVLGDVPLAIFAGRGRWSGLTLTRDEQT